jgi:hypothetical protein
VKRVEGVRVAGALALLALAVVLAGCSGGSGRAGAAVQAAPGCKKPAKWQQLANRIQAPVYCPHWMPDPLNGVIGGRWNNIYSVSPDRSYLIGFIWFERGSGELHVNLRGYPGRTAIPKCPASVGKGTIPCFADPHGHLRVKGIDATVYTVNQGADQWHVLLAWHRNGSLYTLSQHVAAPLTYEGVRADLKRMLRDLVLVQPKT